jgi:hypothetical protein
MNGYLLTAWVARIVSRTNRSGRGDYDTLGSVDTCETLIVCADNPEEAEHRFKQSLVQASGSEQSVSVTIRKVFAAPVMGYLFTESGAQPLDWRKTVEDISAEAESSAVDDFEQGYWLDVSEAVPFGLKTDSIDSLRGSLPEDMSSGLNWSGEKQFFFQLTVFSPSAPPTEQAYDDPDAETKSPDNAVDETTSSEPSQFELLQQQATFPQLADKEVAAIIRARNSAVAAWLWRNYAATTPLARNTIRIDPMCGIALPKEIDAGKE